MQDNKTPRMLVGTDEFYDLVVNSDVYSLNLEKSKKSIRRGAERIIIREHRRSYKKT